MFHKCCATAFALFMTTTLAFANNAWDAWIDLANLKPDQNALKKARTDRGHPAHSYTIQSISKGAGDAVNVDEYTVKITMNPNGWNNSQFLKHIRHNLNDFLDQNIAVFRPLTPGDGTDWTSSGAAKLGTIMVFRIYTLGPVYDDGGVVVSKAGANSWIFSPIEDAFLGGDFGTHPVAGNREFGLRDVAGGVEFYTRAFDRVYPSDIANLAEEKAFEGADALWKSLQSKLADYVNSNGGAATIGTPIVPGGTKPDQKPQYSAVCADSAVQLLC